MIFRSDASHNFRVDKTIRFGTDSVFKKITHFEYNPIPPPIEGYLLLTDLTNFLLTDLETLSLA